MNPGAPWFPTDPLLLYLLQLQGLLGFVVLVAWGIDRMLGRSRPAWRTRVWESALLGILLAPLFCWIAPTLPWRIIDLSPPAVVAPSPAPAPRTVRPIKVVAPPAAPIPKGVLGVDPQFRALSEDPALKKAVPKEPAAPKIAEAEEPWTLEATLPPVAVPPRTTSSFPAYWLLTIWAIGSLFLLTRLIYGWMRLGRALGHLEALANFADRAILDEVKNRLGLKVLPVIKQARGARGPLMVGFLRPRVILPAGIGDHVARSQLIDILVHECAHVLRRDGLVRLLQQGALVLFWVNPLVWLMNRKLDAAREEVCDNYVLRHTSATDYAGTLLSIAERCFPVRETPGLLAMMAQGSGLELRVIDLLDSARDPATEVSPESRSGLWLLFLLVLLLLSAVGIQAEPGNENPIEIVRSIRPSQAVADLPKESTALGQAGADRDPQVSEPEVTKASSSNAALAQADPVQTLPGRDEPKADPVKEAIDRAVQFLRAQERGNGNLEVDPESGVRRGGWTSLALLALLNAGTSTDDPMVQRCLTYLRRIVPEDTYTASLQTCVFAYAGLPEDRRLVQRNLEWLMIHRRPTSGNRFGGWDYGTGTGSPDNSNTQFALMAVHDGYWYLKNRADMPLGEGFMTALRQCKADLISSQHPDGGWSYRIEPITTITMTSSGLASLSSLATAVKLGETRVAPDGSEENCGVYEENSTLIKARRWLEESFPKQLASLAEAKRVLNHPYYGLHGVQRAGKSTGQRFVGGNDWYQIGCDFLVKSQAANGSWGSPGSGGSLDNWPVVATSFAVLFLSRGRTPVLVSKFAHHGERSWNRKHSDLEHLVPFVSREAFEGKPLAWQVFDTSKIPLEEPRQREYYAKQLLESPVVWLSGHQEVPEGNARRLLKSYLDQGGFLFAEACCASQEFDRNFRQMMQELYPGGALAQIPADHPIWTSSGKPLATPGRFTLYGIVQEGKIKVVYSPKAISGYWEGNLKSDGAGADAFRLGANVIAYATGKKMPLPRLSTALAARP